MFLGILVYTFFAEAVTRAPQLVLSNPGYVKRVVFPLEVLPLSVALALLLNLVIGFVLLLVADLVFLGAIPVTAFWLPALLLPLFLLTMGASWFLASLGVFLRDIPQIVRALTLVLMFLTPIFWEIEMAKELEPWIYLNPLTCVVVPAKQALIRGEAPDLALLGGRHALLDASSRWRGTHGSPRPGARSPMSSELPHETPVSARTLRGDRSASCGELVALRSHSVRCVEAPSVYWQDFVTHFAYVFDLAPSELEEDPLPRLSPDERPLPALLLRGCWLSRLCCCVDREHFAAALGRLLAGRGGAWASASMGEHGRVSHDLLRYMGVLVDLYEAGLLARDASSRACWSSVVDTAGWRVQCAASLTTDALRDLRSGGDACSSRPCI